MACSTGRNTSLSILVRLLLSKSIREPMPNVIPSNAPGSMVLIALLFRPKTSNDVVKFKERGGSDWMWLKLRFNCFRRVKCRICFGIWVRSLFAKLRILIGLRILISKTKTSKIRLILASPRWRSLQLSWIYSAVVMSMHIHGCIRLNSGQIPVIQAGRKPKNRTCNICCYF